MLQLSHGVKRFRERDIWLDDSSACVVVVVVQVESVFPFVYLFNQRSLNMKIYKFLKNTKTHPLLRVIYEPEAEVVAFRNF